MSFGSRLKERRKKLGISQPQLAEILGVTKGAIGNWETDVNSPRATLLYKVFDILKCDANYLFQDEMIELYRDKVTPKEFEEIIQVYRLLDDSGKEYTKLVLNRELERTKLAQNSSIIQEEAEQYTYPYYKKIACAGSGFYFDDIPADTISVPFMNGADFIIGVNGDSMEPDFYDGDMVYVQKCEYIQTGEVGIFTINNECFIKELGQDRLISRNKAYDDIPASEDIRLIGKVIGKVLGNV